MQKGRRKKKARQRPPNAWMARGGLAVCLLLLGSFGTVTSFANVLVKADPASAHRLARGNGSITATDAETMFALRPVSDGSSESARLARLAILQDSTAVGALTVLGFQAQLRGETTRSNRIFAYSTQLSRRELRPRIWAIEAAVSRGDIVNALHHYDIALRTSSDAQAALFPTLASALSEPRIRTEILRILLTKPAWGDAFIGYVSQSQIAPQEAARLFSEGERRGLLWGRDVRANLVNALISKGLPDEAWTYYMSIRGRADPRKSRDPNFALTAATRTAFDWRIGPDAGLSVAILNEGQRGLVDFAVPPSTGGVLVRQTQLLPAGVYRIEGRSELLDQPKVSRPYWTLTCQDGRELARVVVPNSSQSGGRFTGRFSVPQACSIQTLALIARASDNIMGVSGRITEARLVPNN